MPPEMVHDLKCWREPFSHVWWGAKLFEFRRNDRNFSVNDVLLLREWNEHNRYYTGREIRVRITYILDRGFGIPEGHCILSLDPQDMIRTPAPTQSRCIKDCLRCKQDPEGHCADDEPIEEQRRDTHAPSL